MAYEAKYETRTIQQNEFIKPDLIVSTRYTHALAQEVSRRTGIELDPLVSNMKKADKYDFSCGESCPEIAAPVEGKNVAVLSSYLTGKMNTAATDTYQLTSAAVDNGVQNVIDMILNPYGARQDKLYPGQQEPLTIKHEIARLAASGARILSTIDPHSRAFFDYTSKELNTFLPRGGILMHTV